MCTVLRTAAQCSLPVTSCLQQISTDALAADAPCPGSPAVHIYSARVAICKRTDPRLNQAQVCTVVVFAAPEFAVSWTLRVQRPTASHNSAIAGESHQRDRSRLTGRKPAKQRASFILRTRDGCCQRQARWLHPEEHLGDWRSWVHSIARYEAAGHQVSPI